jgi:hypothetical protein
MQNPSLLLVELAVLPLILLLLPGLMQQCHCPIKIQRHLVPMRSETSKSAMTGSLVSTRGQPTSSKNFKPLYNGLLLEVQAQKKQS